VKNGLKKALVVIEYDLYLFLAEFLRFFGCLTLTRLSFISQGSGLPCIYENPQPCYLQFTNQLNHCSKPNTAIAKPNMTFEKITH